MEWVEDLRGKVIGLDTRLAHHSSSQTMFACRLHRDCKF